MIVKKKSLRVINETTIPKRDSEFDWRDRLTNWHDVQVSAGTIASYSILNKDLLLSCSGAVINCLQAPYSAKQLTESVE